MSEKNTENKEIEKVNTDSILSVALEYAKTTKLWNFVAGMVILILALQLSWLSIWTITDKWFWLKQTQMEQSFELQKQSFEYMKTEIKPQLDAIVKRLDNNDSRINSLENRLLNIETEFKEHKKTWK